MQMINIRSSQLYETKQSLLILRLAELQAAVIAHFVHNGQAGQFVTLAAQLVAARLEAFFNADADTRHTGSGLLADIQQTAHGLAVCQKVVQNQHTVAEVQKLFGQGDIILAAIGKGLHLGGIDLAVNVLALGLFGEHDRHVEIPGGHAGDGNAGSLDGQDLVHAVIFKNAVELPADLVQQVHVQLVVQKTVYFQYIAGTDLPILQNAIFQVSSANVPLSQFVFVVKCNTLLIMANFGAVCKNFTKKYLNFLRYWHFDNFL